MFQKLLDKFNIHPNHSGVFAGEWVAKPSGEEIHSVNPSNGKVLGTVLTASIQDYEKVLENAGEGFKKWRDIPAPLRGDIVRRIGIILRENKAELALLICLESGKILIEAKGEVQEMIDMCDFASGLSRQLYGLTIASERPQHRLLEQWHPLGIIGIITAFNFPGAVWAWNAILAAVCGDSSVWKPSAKTPLTSIAIYNMINLLMKSSGNEKVFSLCMGAGNEAGVCLAKDPRVSLLSATGSCTMGRNLAPLVSARLGRSLLELGGNNAAIVCASANLELALKAVVFSAIGTTGQRCTSLRRLFLHQSIEKKFTEQLIKTYQSIRIGNPWEHGVLMGPLISSNAVENMMLTVIEARKQGANVVYGGIEILSNGCFVEPTLILAPENLKVMQKETFAPILYIQTFKHLEEAIALNNGVAQGLSSTIFTESLSDSEYFLSARGSDCGIANVNLGTTGAEIGGAFGGEKDSGGGRESGSDSWKNYMRRQTCTINGGSELPLAQGVRFQL